jgi:hypothetical protein
MMVIRISLDEHLWDSLVIIIMTILKVVHLLIMKTFHSCLKSSFLSSTSSTPCDNYENML